MDAKYTEWMSNTHIVGRSEYNREIVTARASYYRNSKKDKIRLRLSIGLVIADLLNLAKGDRVNVYLSKKNKNKFLIKKSNNCTGYALSSTPTSNFLVVDICINFYTEFKIKQTIEAGFDFNENKELLIDISKLKWEK